VIRPGLPTSIGLHAALFAWILFGWSGATPPEDATVVDAMPIEFVPVGPSSQIRLGQKTAKPKDEMVPKDVKQAAKENQGNRAGTDAREEPPPPPPEAKPPQQKVAELPTPEAKPEPPKPPEPKPEPVKAPEAKPQPKPEPIKVPEPKPDLPKEAEKAKDTGEGKPPTPKDPPKDTKALDKLLDEQRRADEKKAAELKAAADAQAAADKAAKAAAAKAAADKAAAERAAAQTASTGAGKSFSNEISDVLNRNSTGSSSGRETRVASLGSPNGRLNVSHMTQSETDALIGQIKKCWNPPIGAAEANIKVVLRFSLNRDGTLNGNPEPVSIPSHPAGVGLARSAQRALMQCGPYRMPPDKYTVWQLVEATFDPKDVF
jgi:colicin import membrane protein